ncbi:MAG: PilZ domain-containing protein [Vulcanimicrobiota bacterium]
MKELRETVRFGCQEEVVCRLGKRGVDARILDISRGGVRLSLSQTLKVGQQVEIKPKYRSRGRAGVAAVVRWQTLDSRPVVGLEFLEPEGTYFKKWLRNLFPQKGKAWNEGRQQRAEVRADCSLPVVSLDGKWEGYLQDLSLSGASFRKESKSPEPARIFLCLPWDYIEATATPVRTCKDGKGWLHSVKLSELKAEEQEHLALYLEQSFIRTSKP